MLEVAKLVAVYDADTRGFDQKSKDVEGTLEKLSSGAGVFGGFVGAQIFMQAANALSGLAAEGVQAYASFERLGMSLQSMAAREALSSGAAQNMGQALAMSSGKASELVTWIQQLAVKSPFTREGVSVAFQQAMAYGFTADEAQRLTQAMIDFAAGSGASEGAMSQIALALGQIQAKGKLSGQEILQLVNAGIPVQQVLSKAFGKSTAEIAKMTEQGLIPANSAIEAIVQSLEQDFGGAAERQAESVAGLISSLSDLKDINLTAFVGGFFEEVQPYLAEFVDALSDPAMQKNMAELGRSVGELATTLIDGGREILSIWEGMPDWMQNVTVAMVGMEMATPPLIDGLGRAAVSLNNWGGMLKSLPGFYRDVQVAQSLLQEGAGVFDVMSTGAAGLTATLGPLAIALAAVTAVAVTYDQTVGKAQREGMAANTQAWAKAIDEAAKNSDNANKILEAYATNIEKVNAAHEEGGWIADVFVDKQAIIQNGLGVTLQALTEAATSWEEYNQAALEAVTMSGYQVDAQGRIYKTIGQGWGPVKQYVDDLTIMTRSQWAATDAITNASDYFDRYTAAMQAANNGIIELNEAAVDNDDIMSALGESLKEAGRGELEMQAALEAVAEELGITQAAGRQAAESVALLSDAFALGVLDQQQYVDYMRQAQEGTLNLDTETRNALEGMVNNATATREAAQAAADASKNYWDLAGALKGASEADFARQMLGQLGELLENDTPNVALYNQAYRELALQYGIVSEQSMALAGVIPILTQALQEGTIAPEQLSEAMNYLFQDAADGIVNWETFAQKFALTETFSAAQSAMDTTGASVLGFGEDVTATTSILTTEFPAWAKTAGETAQAISQVFVNEDWAGIGLSITEGVSSGIARGAGSIKNAAAEAARGAYEAAMRALDAHSPSRKGMYIGKMFVVGQVEALRAGSADLAQAAAFGGEQMASAAQKSSMAGSAFAQSQPIANSLPMPSANEIGQAVVSALMKAGIV